MSLYSEHTCQIPFLPMYRYFDCLILLVSIIDAYQICTFSCSVYVYTLTMFVPADVSAPILARRFFIFYFYHVPICRDTYQIRSFYCLWPITHQRVPNGISTLPDTHEICSFSCSVYVYTLTMFVSSDVSAPILTRLVPYHVQKSSTHQLTS